MATNKTTDPTAPIRLKASRYPGVDEGTACTQNSFKSGNKAFLYIGIQGGRYKAMFKLQDSIPEATRLAKADPDCYQVGTGGWVTARFTADSPLPKATWQKWLDESYALSAAGSSTKQATKKKKKKTARKKATTKTSPKKSKAKSRR